MTELTTEEKISKQDNTVRYLQYLRVLGSLLVVSIHVCAQFFYIFDQNTYQWIASTFFNALSRTAVPIFFFISGALYLDENKDCSIHKILKKILRFVIITTVWIAIYFLSDFLIYNQTPDLANYKYHLWFMFDYIILLALTPVLRLCCKKENKKTIKYLLIVFCIGFVLISLLENIKYLNSDITIVKLVKQISTYISNFKINQIGNCVILFITGWYITTFDLSRFKKVAYIIIGANVISAISLVIFSAITKTKYAFYFFSDYYGIFVYFTTVAILIIFKYSKFSQNKNTCIDFLANNAFIIYLLHMLLIDIVFYFFGSFIYNICSTAMSFIYIPVLIFLVYILTFAVSLLFSLIPKKIKKFLC